MHERLAIFSGNDRSIASTDTEPVQAIEDNSSTFEVLYRRYRDRIYWYLLARTGSEEDAADLTQAVFLRALEAYQQYYPQKGSFLAWLVTIARNHSTNFLQRRRVTISWDYTPSVSCLTTEQDVEAEVVQQENITYLRQLVKTLDVQKQELLVLRFVIGLTTMEIAVVLGKSNAAIKKQFSRMLQEMKEQYHVITQ